MTDVPTSGILCFKEVAVKLKSRLLAGWEAPTYNPSYSGGRDQEDVGSRPAQTKYVCESSSQLMAGCGDACLW
jgi:hypothetical protein